MLEARTRAERKVGVVGTGRVGAVLAAALRAAGHHVTAAPGLSDTSMARVEEMLPGGDLGSPDAVAAASELVVLAVPDDSLPGLVRGLAAAGAWHAGQVVVHTSGIHGLGALEPARAAGATTIALHPAMTFTGTPVDLPRLDGATWAVTSRDDDRAEAEGIVRELGGIPAPVDTTRRALYHAALAGSANHLVTLVAEAADLLELAGVEEPREVLGPLLRTALERALEEGDRALTGPIARGDAGTIRAHLAALGAESPGTLESYRALGRRTTQRAIAAGTLGYAAADDVLEALDTVEQP